MTSDLNQLMTRLDTDPRVKHWTLKCENREGKRRYYNMKLWANSKRYTVYGMNPAHAIQRALQSLREGPPSSPACGRKKNTKTPGPSLKLVSPADDFAGG